MLNDSSNEESKFATKKWYVIDSQTTKGKYKQDYVIKFETETIKSSLCDCSDAFILVTGNNAVAADDNTDVALELVLEIKKNGTFNAASSFNKL